MIDFAIIGAQKSGTSALAHFLSQHPAIAMSQPKEPHIFDAEDYQFDAIESKYDPFFHHFFRQMYLQRLCFLIEMKLIKE